MTKIPNKFLKKNFGSFLHIFPIFEGKILFSKNRAMSHTIFGTLKTMLKSPKS